MKKLLSKIALVMSVSLFALKESLKIPPKCETKVLVKTGTISNHFNENQLINRQILKSIQGTIRTKG
jgi:hypothetical protein